MGELKSLKTADKGGARVYSIDILRGLAILFMVLSSLEPFGNLPAWMYHAQTPPPNHGYDPSIPGLTWVDLVFPFFIFSMGAAIPFSLRRRFEKGMTTAQGIWAMVKRGFMLLGFAIYARHINPSTLSASPDKGTYLLAIFMFFLMFAIWGRFPWKISESVKRIIKFAGIFIAAFVFYITPFSDGSGFSLFRTNIILFVLANLAAVGGIIWIITRDNLIMRVGVLGIMTAIQYSYAQDGNWIHTFGNEYQIPFLAAFFQNNVDAENLKYFSWIYNLSWIFQWRFMKYLYIIIPASIVGDMVYDSLKSSSDATKIKPALNNYLAGVLMVVILVVTLCGLQGRYVVLTTVSVAILILLGLYLFRKATGSREILLSKLFGWGAFWIMLGLLFEPSQGGIKKDPSNMSYYFTTAGLAIFSVIAIEIFFETARRKRIFNLFIYSGQNPMIAYLTTSNVLLPVLTITSLRSVVFSMHGSHPWVGFVIGVSLVVVVGLWVSLFSRRKIFLRT
ncbi:MAG: DUF5009 domain-containing protein [Sedimentisphaeraceae bacterium JB056]